MTNTKKETDDMEKRFRSNNFNKRQEKVVTDMVVDNYELLFGSFSNKVTKTRKNKQWNLILMAVNAEADTESGKRSLDQIKSKWKNLKTSMRAKTSFNNILMKQSGNYDNDDFKELTSNERKIRDKIGVVAYKGLGAAGVDTTILDDNPKPKGAKRRLEYIDEDSEDLNFSIDDNLPLSQYRNSSQQSQQSQQKEKPIWTQTEIILTDKLSTSISSNSLTNLVTSNNNVTLVDVDKSMPPPVSTVSTHSSTSAPSTTSTTATTSTTTCTTSVVGTSTSTSTTAPLRDSITVENQLTHKPVQSNYFDERMAQNVANSRRYKQQDMQAEKLLDIEEKKLKLMTQTLDAINKQTEVLQSMVNIQEKMFKLKRDKYIIDQTLDSNMPPTMFPAHTSTPVHRIPSKQPRNF